MTDFFNNAIKSIYKAILRLKLGLVGKLINKVGVSGKMW